MSINTIAPSAVEAGMLEEIGQSMKDNDRPSLLESNPNFAKNMQARATVKAAQQEQGRFFNFNDIGIGLRAGTSNSVDLSANNLKSLAGNIRSFKDALNLQAAAADLTVNADIASSVVKVWAQAVQTASDRISPIR